MKFFCIALTLLIFSTLTFAQEVSVDIAAVDLEASYIEYTGYVNERDHDFVAKANPNSLALTYNPESFDQSFSLEITALANDFDSGNWFRDQNGRRTVFETKKFPEIKFSSQNLVLEGVTESGLQPATLTGQLTVKDVSLDVSVPITLNSENQKLIVDGSFTVLLSDFGIKRPSAIGDVVDDDILLAFHIELSSVE